ncbi:MAG: hypothetical protein MMC33_001418 [Icmadophila ericetorum]|nr:hypothetical protein [Icmadophila ericetorum]
MTIAETSSVSYSEPGAKLKTEILAPIGSTFEQSYSRFTEYFQTITKSTWEEHLAKRDDKMQPDKRFSNKITDT